MPSWLEYKQTAQQRGSLAYELFAVISTPSGDIESVRHNLQAHLSYQTEQEELGNLAFAGPLSDEAGENMNGDGLIIYRAESYEAAMEFALNDPMHRSGARSFKLRRWLINEGSLCLNLKI